MLSSAHSCLRKTFPPLFTSAENTYCNINSIAVEQAIDQGWLVEYVGEEDQLEWMYTPRTI